MTASPTLTPDQIAEVVKRLNDWAVYAENEIAVHAGPYTIDGDMREAAALITSQQATIEAMRGALEEIRDGRPERIADNFLPGPAVLWRWAQERARDVLSTPRSA